MALTRGATGSLLLDEHGQFSDDPGKSVQVVDTVGAGDAMLSGVVAGKIGRLPLAECARLATGFALGAITRVEPGLPSTTEIEALMHQVSIEPFDPEKEV